MNNVHDVHVHIIIHIIIKNNLLLNERMETIHFIKFK